jgi:hypothetical protein
VDWDPVTLARTALQPTGAGGGIRSFAVSLPPSGSLFVLAGTDADPPVEHESRVVLSGEWSLELPGRDPVRMAPGPRPWTELDDDARGFSGTGEYRLAFEVDAATAAAHRLLLDLDRVGDIARVTVNDIECGIVWTPPFRADVTAAVRPGRNTLRIAVTNPWRNRLISEASEPTGDVFAPMAAVYEPTAAPLPAGLAGTVTLIVQAPRE